jgi:cytochrome c peroxidase
VARPDADHRRALGKQFFWDKRWSRNGTVACVTCHDPDHAWADPRQFSARFDGARTPRHSPTLVNRLFSDLQQWAGTRASLEDQALKASDQAPELLVKNLGSIAAYQQQFRKVFGTDLNPDGVAKAIAAYERTILSGNAPYDRFRAGDTGALSPAAQRGLALFEGKAGCAPCHAGFNFTDEGYHNIGEPRGGRGVLRPWRRGKPLAVQSDPAAQADPGRAGGPACLPAGPHWAGRAGGVELPQ